MINTSPDRGFAERRKKSRRNSSYSYFKALTGLVRETATRRSTSGKRIPAASLDASITQDPDAFLYSALLMCWESAALFIPYVASSTDTTSSFGLSLKSCRLSTPRLP